METWIIGDLHFGHRNICKYRTQFDNPEEHEEFICDEWQRTITKGGDRIFFMGDAAFTWEGLQKIGKLRGKKFLIRGNHDTLSTNAYLDVFEEVYGLWRFKNCWLSHAPVHPSELRGLVNIHGHCHADEMTIPWHKGISVEIGTIKDNRYVNACPEFIGYAPVPFRTLVPTEKMKRKDKTI